MTHTEAALDVVDGQKRHMRCRSAGAVSSSTASRRDRRGREHGGRRKRMGRMGKTVVVFGRRRQG
jgi:hypothetical protein